MYVDAGPLMQGQVFRGTEWDGVAENFREHEPEMKLAYLTCAVAWEGQRKGLGLHLVVL